MDEKDSLYRLLDVRTAADLLDCSPSTLKTLIEIGSIPAVRMGRKIKIKDSDLRAYIDGLEPSHKRKESP
jgi:excisionase family DNA binding protein